MKLNEVERPAYRRCIIFSMAVILALFTSLLSSPAYAAADSTTATYYQELTIFTKTRTHSSAGYMSWENQGGRTNWSNGATTSTFCGGALGDAVALRRVSGGQFAVAYFTPVSYSWKSFPISYGPRDFVMSFKINGTCGAPPWETSRYVWGILLY